MKKYLITLGLTTLAGLALAHEFWLEPDRFLASVGDTISLRVLVGENFTGEPSEGRKNWIIQYRHHTATGTTNLTPGLAGDTYGNVPVRLTTPGTHLFSFANTPKFLSMRADSFLLYLREDGLDAVIEARRERGESSQRSRERYQRCVKALVQVGGQPDATATKNTGMPLEISPVQNPYGQRPGQLATFSILFQNKPLANALVRYWTRDAANHLHQEKQRSDAKGQVRFRLRAGRNMVSLVQMVRDTDPAQADWHSYWGSLTFGINTLP